MTHYDADRNLRRATIRGSLDSIRACRRNLASGKYGSTEYGANRRSDVEDCLATHLATVRYLWGDR